MNSFYPSIVNNVLSTSATTSAATANHATASGSLFGTGTKLIGLTDIYASSIGNLVSSFSLLTSAINIGPINTQINLGTQTSTPSIPLSLVPLPVTSTEPLYSAPTSQLSGIANTLIGTVSAVGSSIGNYVNSATLITSAINVGPINTALDIG